VFSDGLTEAHNPSGEMFCEWRVVETLVGAPPWSAGKCLTALLNSVEEFQAGLAQEDDLSLLLVSRM
jgi:serine phosphatase RsbU (regulator of sigma subunit)